MSGETTIDERSGERYVGDDGTKDVGGCCCSIRVGLTGGAFSVTDWAMNKINGNPAMAYLGVSGSTYFIVFRRSSSADGRGAWSASTVVSLGSSISSAVVDLIEVNGRPAVCYRQGGSGGSPRYRYVRAGDANGTSWGSSVPISGDFAAGRGLSMIMAGGNPAIAADMGNSLTYFRSNDAVGNTWSAGVDIIFRESAVGTMRIINGNPAVSFYDERAPFGGGFSRDLSYARASNTSGTSWPTPQILDSAGTVGTQSYMVVVGGNPAIFYYDQTNTQLKYIRALDADGSSWGAPVVVDADGREMGGMAVIDGVPFVFYDVGGSIIYGKKAVDALGADWSAPRFTVRNTFNIDADQSPHLIDIFDGKPAVMYRVSNGVLYHRASQADGEYWR